MKEYYVALGFIFLWQVICNILLLKEIRKDKKPWGKFAKECQETRVGQLMMTIYYWPTALIVSL